MFVNWGVEALKWKLSVSMVHPVSFLQAYKAVLAGVSFSVTTPNRVGEYLGRMMYLPEGKRLKIISITLVGSLSQILVTVTMGTIGFLVLQSYLLRSGLINRTFNQVAEYVLIFIIIILTLFYFKISALEKVLERWLKRSPYLYLIQSVGNFTVPLLLTLLLLSLLRYGVFMMQYILLFRLFDVHATVADSFWVMSIVFLTLAVIPSIALIEVGIRGEISLELMGLFSANSLGITLTAVSIWLINLIIPAIAGSLLIVSINVFKKRNETV